LRGGGAYGGWQAPPLTCPCVVGVQLASISAATVAAMPPAARAAFEAARAVKLAGLGELSQWGEVGTISPPLTSLSSPHSWWRRGSHLPPTAAASLSHHLSPPHTALLRSPPSSPLTQVEMKLLSFSQVAGFTARQVAHLTAAQLAALPAELMAALSPEALAAISPATLAALPPSHVAALPALSTRLSPAQLAALPAATLAALPADAAAAVKAMHAVKTASPKEVNTFLSGTWLSGGAHPQLEGPLRGAPHRLSSN
jgi:hypothetical protein